MPSSYEIWVVVFLCLAIPAIVVWMMRRVLRKAGDDNAAIASGPLSTGKAPPAVRSALPGWMTNQDELLARVLSRLTLVSRLNLPMGEALRILACSESREVARVLRAIAWRVDAGASVVAALVDAPVRVPENVFVALRRAESVGQLPGGLQAQLASRSFNGADLSKRRFDANLHSAMAYVIPMLTFVTVLVGGISYFVLPKLRAITTDFGVALPWSTRVLNSIANWFFMGGWLIIPSLVLGAYLFWRR